MTLSEALKLSEELEAGATPEPWFFSEAKNYLAVNVKNEMRRNGRQRVCISVSVNDAATMNPAHASNFHLIVHMRNTHMKYVETVKVLIREMKAIYTDAQKGDGTTTECHVVALAEEALQTVEKIWSGE